MARYAMTDIHGCAKTFRKLLEKIGLAKGDTLFLLGDYIDRGPDSKGVVDTIFELKKNGVNTICLRGNHEQMLLDAMENPELFSNWYGQGGKATLESFGVENPRAISRHYLRFFDALPFYHLAKDYVMVHAGLNFNASAPLADKEALLWIRDWYGDIDYAWLDERLILHGHTPMPLEEVKAQHSRLRAKRYLDLDSGCAWVERPGMGYLSACDIDANILYHIPNQE